MIDLHFHALAGIDDGPGTPAESVALVRRAQAAGTRTIVATPHVSWRYPNEPQGITQAIAELRAALAAEQVPVEIAPGAEIALTRLPELDEAQLASLSLGGGPWLLVEPPFSPVATGLDASLIDLAHRGHSIVIAHPERCPAFHRDPEMLGRLVRSGMLVSVTAGALEGRFGERVRRFALELAREELVHNVASDAHDLNERPPLIAQALERSGLAPLGPWLTEEIPRAILAGEAVPARPGVTLKLARPRRRPWDRSR